MTVQSNLSKHIYDGNGVTTEFPFTFPITNKSDIKVYIRDNTGTLSLLSSGYTVNWTDGDESGTVTYPSDTNADKLPTGSKLVLLRICDLVQLLDLSNTNGFKPGALETALDLLTMIVQQVREELDRAVKIPVDSSDSVETLIDVISDYAISQSAANAARAELAQGAAEDAQEITEAARDTTVAAKDDTVAAKDVTVAAKDVTVAAAENALAAIFDIAFATKAIADADLSHAAGTKALIYADSSAANNGLYIKIGDAGAGSWVKSEYDPFYDVWHNQVSIILSPSANGAISLSSVGLSGSYTTVFSLSSGLFVNFIGAHQSIPSLSISLNNLQCCYLDLDTFTWSSATEISGVKDKQRLIVFVNLYGRIYSPIPSVQSLLDYALSQYNLVTASVGFDSDAGRTLFNKHMELAFSPVSGGSVVINSVVSSTVNLDFPAGFLFNFAENYGSVPASAGLSLANLGVLYADITSMSAITLSTGTAATGTQTLKSSINKVILVLNVYGKLFSPIPSIQKLLSEAEASYTYNNALLLYQKQVNVGFGTVSGNPIIINTIAGTTIGLTVPQSIFTNFKDAWGSVPAKTATLENTQGLYIDTSNLSAITWSDPVTVTNVKTSIYRVLAIYNFYGKLYSPIPALQKLLTAAETAVSTTTVIVAADGGGDYTTITAAIAAITDARSTKQYLLKIKNGTYNECNIVNKNYINWRGESRDGVIIRADGTIDEEKTIVEQAGLFAETTCLIENITLDTNDTKYCIHNDSLASGYDAIFSNCRFRHRGCTDHSYYNPVGIGARANQNNKFVNCEFVAEDSTVRPVAVYWHNWDKRTGRGILELTDCVAVGCDIASLVELGSEQPDVAIISNCASTLIDGRIALSAIADYYGGNVADVPYCIQLCISGSVPFIDINRTTRPDITKYNFPGVYLVTALNSGESAIAAGSGVAYDYAGFAAGQNAGILATSGTIDGVSQYDILAGSVGYIVPTKHAGYVLATANDYAVGNLLKCNTDGTFSVTAVRSEAVAVVLSAINLVDSGLINAYLL